MSNGSSGQPSQLTPNPVGAKVWIIGGGVFLLVVLIGIGWLVFKRPSAQSGQSSVKSNNGIFSQLPGSSTKTTETTEPQPIANNGTSGLSGMPCVHANRRPIGVMIAGDPINRPDSGFTKADMVWELPVLVSDVTRLMAVYQCGEPTEIGSVRSVRHNYLFLIEGIDGIVAHWGGSYHALNRIAAGEFQTINALTNPFDAFFRKNNLPAPYNGFTSYDRVWNALQKLGYRTTTVFKGYDFKDDPAPADRGPAGTLSIDWPGAFRVSYEYNPTTNRYVRYWAGQKQVDPVDHQEVAPSSVIIMRATNGPMTGPGGYNDVGMEGKGNLEVYQDGKVIKGTWTKNALDKKDPVHFLNDQGQPMIFTRGQLWVMTPDDSIPVTWTLKTGSSNAGQ